MPRASNNSMGLRIEGDLKEELSAIAEKDGRSLSNLVKRILEQFVEEYHLRKGQRNTTSGGQR